MHLGYNSTFADNRIQVLHNLIFRARKSALLIGDPSMKEIFGKFLSKCHSLKTRNYQERESKKRKYVNQKAFLLTLIFKP